MRQRQASNRIYHRLVCDLPALLRKRVPWRDLTRIQYDRSHVHTYHLSKSGPN